ncbi:MAG: hypothetical protein C1943_15935 [Halochromatium sp.]|nr:hypothetical protein [Halochromatium sp.]
MLHLRDEILDQLVNACEGASLARRQQALASGHPRRRRLPHQLDLFGAESVGLVHQLGDALLHRPELDPAMPSRFGILFMDSRQLREGLRRQARSALGTTLAHLGGEVVGGQVGVIDEPLTGLVDRELNAEPAEQFAGGGLCLLG